jgi:RNA polymerase sigma factor (sigma-70 family)
MSAYSIQRSERRVPSSPPYGLKASHKAKRNIVVRAEASTDGDGLSIFLGARVCLLSIARRMLKSAAEAEDIVQDVWIRWQATDQTVVRNAMAFLAATTIRLAINVIQSARSRRETPIGSSPREPMVISHDSEWKLGRSEALQSAVIVLLEQLSPAERAAYVLREAFDYSYREIANTLRLKEANTRQLVARARQRVSEGQCATRNSAEQQRFFDMFVAAAQEGALRRLEVFLAGSVDGTAGKYQRTVPTVLRDNRSTSPSLVAAATA